MTVNHKTHPEMRAIGLNYERWQDAVEAAISTNQLAVTGEVRGGQLIQFADASGAQINILAVEPFATFIGFESVTQGFAHVSMINDVLAYLDIIDPFGTVVAQATANLAQGPLLVDEDTQQWQQVELTALGLDVARFDSTEAYEAEKGSFPATFESEGAQIVASGSGAAAPPLVARLLPALWSLSGATTSSPVNASCIWSWMVRSPSISACPRALETSL